MCPCMDIMLDSMLRALAFKHAHWLHPYQGCLPALQASGPAGTYPVEELQHGRLESVSVAVHCEEPQCQLPAAHTTQYCKSVHGTSMLAELANNGATASPISYCRCNMMSRFNYDGNIMLQKEFCANTNIPHLSLSSFESGCVRP